PLYLKKFYADEPLFDTSKIVISVYGKSFEGELDLGMKDRIAFDGLPEESIASLETPTYNNLLKIAVDNSDAVILASETIPEELENHISNLEKPVLPYVSLQEFEDAYANFYNTEVLK
ncbi:MAG: glycogen/starch synthase, partial [Pricia sp.]